MSDPVWDAKNPQVPVDKDGNWLSYPGWGQDGWRAVEPWFDVLEVDSMETGRSSKLVILKDEDGNRYPMFVSDMVKGIQERAFRVHDGKLSGIWTASKRGKNYGIKAVK